MSPDPLTLTRTGAVLEVVLDRPKANAIDAATSRRMGEAFATFAELADLAHHLRQRRVGPAFVPPVHRFDMPTLRKLLPQNLGDLTILSL